jgi:hypothetical protein
VQGIAADVKAMDAALAGGSIAGVSDKANSVATLAKTMGALAARQGERRAARRSRKINLASKELAEAAGNLHNIADAGDVAKSKAAFAPVKAAAAKVAALAPAMAEGHDHAHGAEAVAVTHTVTVAAEGSKAIEAGQGCADGLHAQGRQGHARQGPRHRPRESAAPAGGEQGPLVVRARASHAAG